nr:hypothetical protein [Tanacetum cinerariifolium]
PQPRIGQRADLVHAQVRFEFVELQLGVGQRQRARAEPAIDVDVGLDHARLRHEAVVVHKAGGDRFQLQFVPPVVADAGELAHGVAALALRYPCSARRKVRCRCIDEAGAVLRMHQQPQGLAAVAAPLAVHAHDRVAARVAVAALRDKGAKQRAVAVPARAHQAGQGAARLRVFGRLVGAAAQHHAALLVAQAHGRGVGLGIAPGGAQTPFRIGHRARVKGGQGQPEHVGAFEEKAALFRQAEGNAAGAGRRGFVDLHLRKVGIERGVEHPVRARAGIELEPHGTLVATLAAECIAVAAGAHRQLGLDLHEAAIAHGSHRAAHAADILQQGDVAQRSIPERGTGEQEAVRMGHAAFDHHAPGLAVGVGKTQVRQRPADLHAVAVGQAPDCGVDGEVGAQVRFIEVGAVHAVAERAGDVHPYELRGAAMPGGIEPHADEILVQAHLVAPGERAAHALGRIVPRADAEDQRAVIDQQPHRGAQVGRRRLAVGRQELVEGVERRRQAPRFFIERAVHLQGHAALEQHGRQRCGRRRMAFFQLHGRNIGSRHDGGQTENSEPNDTSALPVCRQRRAGRLRHHAHPDDRLHRQLRQPARAGTAGGHVRPCRRRAARRSGHAEHRGGHVADVYRHRAAHPHRGGTGPQPAHRRRQRGRRGARAGSHQQPGRPPVPDVTQAVAGGRAHHRAHPVPRRAARGHACAVGRRVHVVQNRRWPALDFHHGGRRRLRPVLALHRSSDGQTEADRPAHHGAGAAGRGRQWRGHRHARTGRLAHVRLARQKPQHLWRGAQHRPVRTALGRLREPLRQYHSAALLVPEGQPGQGEAGAGPVRRIHAHARFLREPHRPLPVRRRKNGRGRNSAPGHGTPDHQRMTNADWDDMWLHEGFGSYMQPLYLQSLRGEMEFQAELFNQRKALLNKVPVVSGKTQRIQDIYESERGGPGNDIYAKGSLILHTLRNLIGDDAFFRATRRMVYGTDTPTPCHFQPRWSSTREFIGIANETSGLEAQGRRRIPDAARSARQRPHRNAAHDRRPRPTDAAGTGAGDGRSPLARAAPGSAHRRMEARGSGAQEKGVMMASRSPARWRPRLSGPVCASVLAIALCACDPHYNWREYRSQNHGIPDAPYMVLFPAKPSTHARDVRLGDGLGDVAVHMTMTAAEVDGVVFAVGSAQLPDGAPAPAALQAMATALTRNIGGAITSQAVAGSGAQTTLSMAATGMRNGEPTRLTGRFIARARHVYQVVVIGPARHVAPEQEHAQRILDLLHKNPTRGVITATEAAQALSVLEDQVAESKLHPEADIEHDIHTPEREEGETVEHALDQRVGFAARAYPLVEMLRLAKQENQPIVDGKPRADAHGAVDADRTVEQRADDVVGDAQPQAIAALSQLGGEERIEDAGLVIERDAAAVIFEHDAHRLRSQARRPQAHHAMFSVFERVQQRVVDQVDDHLAVRSREAVHRDIVRHFQFQLMAGLADLVLHRGDDFGAGLVQIEVPAFGAGLVHRHLLEAVDQLRRVVQAAHQQGGCLARRVDEVLEVRTAQGIVVLARFDLRGFRFQRAGDHQAVADRRIEFVRDAGHQRAEGCQLFALHQLLLRVLQLAIRIGVGKRHRHVRRQRVEHIEVDALVGVGAVAVYRDHAAHLPRNRNRHVNQRARFARQRAVLQGAQRFRIRHQLQIGDVARVVPFQVVDEHVLRMVDAPYRQLVRFEHAARVRRVALALFHRERILDQLLLGMIDADAEHAGVHQRVHLLIQHRHDRFAIEIGGDAAADVGQQRDIAVRQLHAFLLPLHFALFAFDRILLLYQFARAAAHFIFQRLLLAHQAPDAQPEQQVADAHHQRDRQYTEPPPFPERRGDDHLQRHRLGDPDAILVGRAHPEHVAAGIEIGVGGKAPVAVGGHPLLVETLELIRIAVALRIGEMQRRELDREHGVVRPERDRSGGIERPLQHILARDVGHDRLVEDREIGNRHLRRHGVVLDARRVEGGNATEAAEVHGAVGRLVAGAHEIRPVEQPILGGVLLEDARVGIEHVDAAGAADPEPALVVAEDGADRIRRTAVVDGIKTEVQLAVRACHGLAQTGARAHPQRRFGVFVQVLHALVAQAVGAVGLVTVVAEFSGAAVHAVEAIFSTHPQGTGAVFQQRIDRAADAVGILFIMAIGAHSQRVRIDPVQAGAGCHPDRAGPVDHHAPHGQRRGVGVERNARVMAGDGIAPRHAGIAAHPQAILLVGRQRHQLVARQTGGILGIGAPDFGGAPGGIEAGQAIGRSDPQLVAASAVYGAHLVVADAVQDAVILGIPLEAAAQQIDLVESRVPVTDPQGAGTVLVERADLVVGNAILVQAVGAVLVKDALVRITAHQPAIKHCQPQVTLAIVQQGHDAAVVEHLGAVERNAFGPVTVDAPGLQAGHAHHPQQSIGTDGQVGDVVRWGGRCLGRQVAKPARSGRQQFEPAGSPYPEIAALVAHHGIDAVVAQAVRVARYMAQALHGPGSQIQMLQPFAGRQPQAVFAIADDVGDGQIDRPGQLMDEALAGPAARIGRIVLEAGDAVTVIAVQSSLGADPQITVAVLQHAGNRLLRQAIFHAQAVETQAEGSRHGMRAQAQPGKQQDPPRDACNHKAQLRY